ncbi:MAG: hypothetical protein ACK4SZ_13230 [Allosphingosinicella sp.]|uniref:hypothetical protein n=1 Tax=Allosphingosinicella sp. TaxID=2823234 RepID=UPI00394312D3
MKLKCRIAGHASVERVVYNSGFFFGRCSHCRADLIRTGKSGWEDVPDGHVVKWKEGGRHSHSLPADFSGLLPVMVGEAGPRPQLPATRDRFFSWSRALVDKPARGWRRKREAVAASAPLVPDEVEEKPLPALLIAALVFGASMRLLLRPRRR